MNLTHLFSELRLDMRHLQWQQNSQSLTPHELQHAFERLASGYTHMVDNEDRLAVSAKVEEYRHYFNLPVHVSDSDRHGLH